PVERPSSISRRGRWLDVFPALIVAVLMFPIKDGRFCLALTDHPWVPDRHVSLALEAQAAPGRLVIPYSWSHYAIWHLGPRLLVSIDQRRETIYSDRALAEQ